MLALADHHKKSKQLLIDQFVYDFIGIHKTLEPFFLNFSRLARDAGTCVAKILLGSFMLSTILNFFAEKRETTNSAFCAGQTPFNVC